MAAKSFAQIPAKALKKPEPFKIEIPEKEIGDLKQSLKLSKLPKPTYESLQEDGRYGLSHKWMTEAKKGWEDFNWRKCEAHMNSFPNFTSNVSVGKEEFTIHFVALFSEKTDAIPVVLFHGWPGNFLEFLPILSLMKQKYTPATLPYHLIVPSLPGYSFSSPPPLDRDFANKDIAAVMNQLMLDLSFTSYVAQGGDIGSRVAKILGVTSESCKAIHVNFSPVLEPPKGISLDSLSPRDRAGYDRGQDFVKMGAAYALFHATRPATIGLALDSSPLALLAWIGEKFLSWSDVDPSLETILESVSLYWFTESMGRGVFPYRGVSQSTILSFSSISNLHILHPREQEKMTLAIENGDVIGTADQSNEQRFNADAQSWPNAAYIEKPFGYSNFPKELIPCPKAWVEKEGNLVFYREHEKGGHFAALEQPELLMGDIEEFVKQVWVQ